MAKEKIDPSLNSLDLARKAIEKEFGNIITYLSDFRDIAPKVISTGSLGLDAALGVGGVALGRIYEFFGAPASGKSTLAFSIVVEAQKMGLKAAYIDAEHGVDPSLLYNMGVNGSDLLFVRGHAGEDNLIAAEKLIKTGEIDVCVIDSVSSLLPRAEAEDDLDANTMALLARLMSKCCRRFAPLASQTNTTVIFINQTRQDIGRYGDPDKPTGGDALAFYATGRIKIRGGESKATRIFTGDGQVVGHHVEFSVIKNKLAIPFRSAKVPLMYGKGFHKSWEIATLGVDLDIIARKGAWYSYKEKNIANGEMNLVNYLEENSELLTEIREKVMDSLGLKKRNE